jgi:hypothetical protein
MESLLTVVVSSLVGGLVAYVGAVVKNTLDMRAKVDESLRDKRVAVYQKLWQTTEILPKWPRRTDVTYEGLTQFSQGLRDWYFREGGMYLSRQARKAYGELQDTIVELGTSKTGPITDPVYDEVRDKCSQLRTELTDDILSRRRLFLTS